MIRKDLLDEALRCAVTIGMRKTSVEQLTEAVGIAKGSFYKVFPSKELLFFAVLENIHAETYAVAEKALQDNVEIHQRSGLQKSFWPPVNTFPTPKP